MNKKMMSIKVFFMKLLPITNDYISEIIIKKNLKRKIDF